MNNKRLVTLLITVPLGGLAAWITFRFLMNL